MSAHPENEEMAEGIVSAASGEEAQTSSLVESVRLARVVLTEAEFWEWIDGLRHPIAPARTGLEDSMQLYRDYLAGEMAQ